MRALSSDHSLDRIARIVKNRQEEEKEMNNRSIQALDGICRTARIWNGPNKRKEPKYDDQG